MMRSNAGMVDQAAGDHHHHQGPNSTCILTEAAEDRHLSGAYIRSLVKQLSSSKPKTLSDRNHQLPYAPADHLAKMTKNGTQQQEAQGQQQQQPKKQVRRRMHTSRPYQERVLNMAEARREIVTALKFHRASMKQAQEKQKQFEQQQQQEAFNIDPVPNRFPSMYPTISSLASCNRDFLAENPHQLSPNFKHTDPSLTPWSSSSSVAPALQLYHHDNFNSALPLPNQLPLGLNLNFQDFNNLETTAFYNNTVSTATKPPQPVDQLPILSPTSASSYNSYSVSSSPSPSRNMPMSGSSLHAPEGVHDQPKGLGLQYPVMDDDVMAEIRSIGEQHDIEWSDTLNTVTSAWWCKFLKSMEAESGEGDRYPAAAEDEMIDVPTTWMNNLSGSANAKEYYFPIEQQYYLDDDDEYLLDAALPWY